MTPFDFLPHRIDILYPQIRIGSAIARKQVNVRRAIEYMQTGLYRQEFSKSGEFLGIVYSPETAKPAKPRYIPAEMPPFTANVPGDGYNSGWTKFLDPIGATPTWMRTVTTDIPHDPL